MYLAKNFVTLKNTVQIYLCYLKQNHAQSQCLHVCVPDCTDACKYLRIVFCRRFGSGLVNPHSCTCVCPRLGAWV